MTRKFAFAVYGITFPNRKSYICKNIGKEDPKRGYNTIPKFRP